MKPLGRRPSRFPGKVDHHPGKGWVNWWEKEFSEPNKARDKREWQQQAKKELDDDSNNNPTE